MWSFGFKLCDSHKLLIFLCFIIENIPIDFEAIYSILIRTVKIDYSLITSINDIFYFKVSEKCVGKVY